MRVRLIMICMALVVCGSVVVMVAQPPPEFGWPGRGGGPGGPGAEDRKLLKQFDADQNSWLNAAERQTARAYVKEHPVEQRGPGDRGPGGGPPGGDPFGLGRLGFGPPGFGPGGPGRRGGGPPGMGQDRPSFSPGESIDKSSVEPLESELYDTNVFRTIFLEFENDDWESELEDFHGTDVDVAATLTVDGQVYPNCGIHFRGMSSYGMVPAGYKRSLNISLDMADENQRLLGYKTLNLLNGSGDASMLSTVLYSHIAAKLEIPAPKANLVRVVINGENWGVYTNVQQFNKDFLREHFGSEQGARWKVSGSPAGGGGLDYRGPDPEQYQHPYERKSGGKEATAKLIELCRVLAETSSENLPAALEPLVHTLYLDTPHLDLYHRSGAAGTTKHRIRRYGNDETLWLECKRKRQNIVHKNRMAVPERDVWKHLVSGAASTTEHWCGDWFTKRIERRQLAPSVDVHYRRFARLACIAGENLRLTIDNQLAAHQVNVWDKSAILNRSLASDRRNLPPVNILELKFNNHLPHVFKELLTEFALSTASFSKYRTAVSSYQLANQPKETPKCDSVSRPIESQVNCEPGMGVAANA